ncbi:MAG: amino acid ABC transporter permease, partial [Anaerolineae bacterium]|nr:amino acid ABC transporter permease [Anaerolineae bacterium]
ALLVAYGLFLLPDKEATGWAKWAALGPFILLVLLWSANVLADGEKPDWFKGLVAFALIGVFCWLFYQYSGTRWDRLGRSFFNLKKMEGAWSELFEGLVVTLELAAVSAVFSVLIGLMVAVLRSLGSPTLDIFLVAYLDLFRSIPMIVLMVVIYYALPYVGIALDSVTATVVALSLGYGAYAAESFRAGIQSVHYGQVEAARALGLTRLQTMRLVILPQAIRVVIPPLTGNLIAMLKDTAVASVVASPELLKRAKELYVGKANPTPLVAAAFIYLLILFPMSRLANYLESRVNKGKKVMSV